MGATGTETQTCRGRPDAGGNEQGDVLRQRRRERAHSVPCATARREELDCDEDEAAMLAKVRRSRAGAGIVLTVKLQFESYLSRLLQRLESAEAAGRAALARHAGYDVLERVRKQVAARQADMSDAVLPGIESILSTLEGAAADMRAAFDGRTAPMSARLASGMELLEHYMTETENAVMETRESINDAGRKVAEAIRKGARQLLTLDEIPDEWRNNKYILTRYRFYESKRACVASICRIHNETGNIWTHLGGLLLLLGLAFYWYPQTPAFTLSQVGDKLVAGVFLAAAVKCLACSAMWHTFCNLANLRQMKRAACMDYVGISVLIAASIITVEYHGFYCQPMAQACYMAFTGALGLLGIIIPWQEWFDKHENRLIKICFFVGIAVSGVLPVLHLIASQGASKTLSFYLPITKSLLSYTIGVLVYANRLPEAFAPGRFDLVFSSHQLWHIMILFGIWYHYQAVITFGPQSRDFACVA